MEQIFNIRKPNDTFMRIETNYNKFLIINDKVKGTAIYMDLGGYTPDILIKSYRTINPIAAISYLIKKNIF